MAAFLERFDEIMDQIMDTVPLEARSREVGISGTAYGLLVGFVGELLARTEAGPVVYDVQLDRLERLAIDLQIGCRALRSGREEVELAVLTGDVNQSCEAAHQALRAATGPDAIRARLHCACGATVIGPEQVVAIADDQALTCPTCGNEVLSGGATIDTRGGSLRVTANG